MKCERYLTKKKQQRNLSAVITKKPASFTGPMPPANLQFFVRLISGKTLVLRANPEDSVKSVHESLQAATGMLIHRGKQLLDWKRSLAEYAVQNDDGLQLVARLRSTEQRDSWRLVGDMLHDIFQFYRGNFESCCPNLSLDPFWTVTPKDDYDGAISHLEIFLASSAPAAMVMLYTRGNQDYSDIVDTSIRQFFVSGRNALPRQLHIYLALILLEFCKLLRHELEVLGKPLYDEPLYLICMDHFQSLLKGISIPELFEYVGELVKALIHHLSLTIDFSSQCQPVLSYAQDYFEFSLPLWSAIVEQNRKDDDGENVRFFHSIFFGVLNIMDKCLSKMEESLAEKGTGEDEFAESWRPYLGVLEELNGISDVCGAKLQFSSFLVLRKDVVRALIIKLADRKNENLWLLELKEVTNYECRKHLAMMMFPELDEQDYDESLEIVIDRSKLLEESYECIINAPPTDLRSGLDIQFKNEEATGHGVLREWFLLVCQAVFNPQNAHFVACPNDRRRFYPSPASNVDPSNLKYFRFSGRMIALALMHKVQVGIIFDRVFFMQLAGERISLEDIQDAEPDLYSSYKDILNMDEELIDSDALGLTFVTNVEELGNRSEVELSPGGKNTTVNSKNRKEYIDLRIQHRFIISIAKQISHFSEGFADILCDAKIPELFFRSLDLQDLDWMLRGSESPISIEDWKAHTVYDGYTETDPQISWFWKIVEEMCEEQKRSLLFFWTSLKYLPIEGFGGLAERLLIGKLDDVLYDRFPSCQTCFYRLNFPPYPSMDVMRVRLSFITQQHVAYSFGTFLSTSILPGKAGGWFGTCTYNIIGT